MPVDAQERVGLMLRIRPWKLHRDVVRDVRLKMRAIDVPAQESTSCVAADSSTSCRHDGMVPTRVVLAGDPNWLAVNKQADLKF